MELVTFAYRFLQMFFLVDLIQDFMVGALSLTLLFVGLNYFRNRG